MKIKPPQPPKLPDFWIISSRDDDGKYTPNLSLSSIKYADVEASYHRLTAIFGKGQFLITRYRPVRSQ